MCGLAKTFISLGFSGLRGILAMRGLDKRVSPLFSQEIFILLIANGLQAVLDEC
jgi:hypothetical protein